MAGIDLGTTVGLPHEGEAWGVDTDSGPSISGNPQTWEEDQLARAAEAAAAAGDEATAKKLAGALVARGWDVRVTDAIVNADDASSLGALGWALAIAALVAILYVAKLAIGR